MTALITALVFACLLTKGIVNAQSRQCDPAIISGRTPNDQFKFPPASCYAGNYVGISSYVLGTQLTIIWATTAPAVDLAIVQENSKSPSGPVQFLIRNTTATTYAFSGYPPQPLSYGNTFFFELFRPGGVNALFASDYINVTSSISSSMSSSLSSSTLSTSLLSSGSATATTAQSTSNAASTAAATTTATANNSGGSSSNSATLGAGIGGGLGGALLIIAMGGLIWYCVRRSKKQKADAVKNSSVEHDKQPYSPAQPSYSAAPSYEQSQYSRQELESQTSGPYHGQKYPAQPNQRFEMS